MMGHGFTFVLYPLSVCYTLPGAWMVWIDLTLKINAEENRILL